MTPAEKLAKTKRRQRPARNVRTVRKTVWKTRLRELREGLNLAMRDVAQACGLSVSAYWQIEGGTDPQLTTARRLTAFFGQTVEQLWPELVNG